MRSTSKGNSETQGTVEPGAIHGIGTLALARQPSGLGWDDCSRDLLLTDSAILRGRHLSYQRGRRTTHPATSLIKIEGVDDTKAAKYVLPWQAIALTSCMLTRSSFYLGKKVAYVYRASTEKRGTKIRVIWGKVTRPHGTGCSRSHACLRWCA